MKYRLGRTNPDRVLRTMSQLRQRNQAPQQELSHQFLAQKMIGGGKEFQKQMEYDAGY
jgi:hypothetical protein